MVGTSWWGFLHNFYPSCSLGDMIYARLLNKPILANYFEDFILRISPFHVSQSSWSDKAAVRSLDRRARSMKMTAPDMAAARRLANLQASSIKAPSFI